MLIMGGALLVVAVIGGLGLRALVTDDDDADEGIETALTVPGEDDAGNDEASDPGSDDDEDTETTEPDETKDPDQDEAPSTTTEMTVSTTTENTVSTASEGGPDPTFGELSGLTLTRTGECPRPGWSYPSPSDRRVRHRETG